jgi:hypothetical protein
MVSRLAHGAIHGIPPSPTRPDNKGMASDHIDESNESQNPAHYSESEFLNLPITMFQDIDDFTEKGASLPFDHADLGWQKGFPGNHRWYRAKQIGDDQGDAIIAIPKKRKRQGST